MKWKARLYFCSVTYLLYVLKFHKTMTLKASKQKRITTIKMTAE